MKIIAIAILSIIFLGPCHISSAQEAMLGNEIANSGEQVLVPLTIESFVNIGTISLFIEFDPSVVTYNGITNIVAQGSGTIANLYVGTTNVLGLSWIAPGSSGVNFPNGKYLDIIFTMNSGYTDLVFGNNCEVTDWDVNALNVEYINGSISAPSIEFDLHVYLEGAYLQDGSGLMSTSLTSSGKLPVNQPFAPSLPYFGNNNPRWFYNGTETVANIPVNAVDWVLVELRDATSAITATQSTMIAQKPCFLLNDGSIVNLDGISLPDFHTSVSQGAFIVIWQRNHLGIMSATPLTESGGIYSYDFSASSTQVSGGSAGYSELKEGVWGMVAGDLNADNAINLQDKNNGWSPEAGKSGYSGADDNLDIQVSNSDKNELILKNVGKISGVPD